MLGFLIFLPTIAYIPHLVYLLSLLYLFFLKLKRKKNIKFIIDDNVKILMIIFFIVLINRLLFLDNHIFVEQKETILTLLIPPFFMIFISYFLAFNLKREDLNILLFLITLEAIVVIIEFYLGKTTFFSGLNRFKEVDINNDNDLLYFFRPMGLSENSSIVAIKLFIGLIILYYNRNYINKFLQIIFYIILILALVFSFNRTAMISIFIFYFLIFVKYYFKSNKKIKDLVIKFLISIFILGIFGYVIYNFGNDIYMQLTRGGNSDVLTGRGAIWHSFFKFISEHILFGNGSYKLYLPFYHGGWTFAHAHNSYLEILASHGLIIFILYMFLIIKNLNRYNIIYIIPFLTFSLTQYFLFWGISLQDIIFFYFLLINKRKNIEKN